MFSTMNGATTDWGGLHLWMNSEIIFHGKMRCVISCLLSDKTPNWSRNLCRVLQHDDSKLFKDYSPWKLKQRVFHTASCSVFSPGVENQDLAVRMEGLAPKARTRSCLARSRNKRFESILPAEANCYWLFYGVLFVPPSWAHNGTFWAQGNIFSQQVNNIMKRNSFHAKYNFRKQTSICVFDVNHIIEVKRANE